MNKLYLLLKSEDVGNAAVNRVPNPSQRLVTKRDHGVEPAVRWDSQEQFGGVASSEHPMHRREEGGALLRVEIRCKNATSHTLPSKEFASTTRPTTTIAAATIATTAVAHYIYACMCGSFCVLIWNEKCKGQEWAKGGIYMYIWRKGLLQFWYFICDLYSTVTLYFIFYFFYW